MSDLVKLRKIIVDKMEQVIGGMNAYSPGESDVNGSEMLRNLAESLSSVDFCLRSAEGEGWREGGPEL